MNLLIIPFVLAIPAAYGEITIQNDQKYIGDDGVLHIVGEVKNDLEMPLNQIKIHALLYSSDKLITTISSSSLVNNIMPGMKAPFDIMVIRSDASDIDRYDLDLEYEIANPKRQVIGITSSDISRDGLDNLVITGTVSNNGEITANTVSVVATIYDRQGNVAAVSKTHTEPDYLRSSEEAFFLLSIQDGIPMDSIIDYTLVAESEEYAAVPEFPLGSGLLLASSVFAYLLLTRYWNKTIANVVAATDLR